MRSKLYSILLILCVTQIFAGEQLSCINWKQSQPSVFTPVANSNNQIAPDYGLYWIKYDDKTGGEDYKRAYTPSDYAPYFSDGQQNNNPDPKDDGGAARANYNKTQLKGFYDPSKPTIIFFHGWQPDMTAQYRRIDFCYRYAKANNQYSPMYNTLQYWKGWNVAIFYWNQFADESDFVDTEAKLYSSKIHQKMRWAYMRPGDPNRYYCSADASNCLMPRDANGNVKNVGELAYEAVVNAIPSVSPKNEFRIAGQSFGAQLATIVADKLINNNAKTLMPTRLILLDPYLSDGSLDNLFDGQSLVDHVNQLITNVESYHIPVSEYRTSDVSRFPTGNWDFWLVAHTAYERLYPKYLTGLSGVQLAGEQHRSSIYLYFQSNRAKPYWSQAPLANWYKSYINAQSTNDQVEKLMDSSRVQMTNPQHTSEYDFPDTQDDVFGAL